MSTFRVRHAWPLALGLTLIAMVGCPRNDARVATGTFIGSLDVTFADGSAAARVSGSSGAIKVKVSERAGSPARLDVFEGVLPGFSKEGTAVARIDVAAGTVSGTILSPEGLGINMRDGAPDLSVERSGPEGFLLRSTSGQTTSKYEMKLELAGGAAKLIRQGLDVDVLTGGVTVNIEETENGNVVRSESGSGTFFAEQADSDSAAVAPLPPPAAPIFVDAGPDQFIAPGGSAQLQASVRPAGGAFTFAWSPADGLSDPAALSPTASPLQTTDYKLTVSAGDGRTAIDVVRVVVGGEPPALVVSAGADLSIDVGESAELAASVSGGSGSYAFAWSPAAGLSSTTVLRPVASPGSTTTYTLNVTDTLGAQASDSVVVSVFPPLSASAGPDRQIPSGGSTTLAGGASGGDGNYTFAWTPTAGLNNPAVAAPLCNVAITTTYTLTVTDGRGKTATDSVVVNVAPPPASGSGKLVGTVKGINTTPDGFALDNAVITMREVGTNTLLTALSKQDGSFEMPGLASKRKYKLTAAKQGFVTAENPTEISILPGKTKSLGTILLAQGAPENFGGLFGQVVNAHTGDGIEGGVQVQISLTTDPNVTQQASGGEIGLFTFGNKLGTYRAAVVAPGFLGSYQVDENTTLGMIQAPIGNQLVRLVPLVGDQFEVQLTWNADSELDLDVHVTGPLAAGTQQRYHVYWDSPGSAKDAPFAALFMQDEVASGGPQFELARITKVTGVSAGSPIRVSVHDFSNAQATFGNALAQSGAKITLRRLQGIEIATFDVPAQPGTLWTALEIRSINPLTVVPIGTMSFVSNPAAIP